MAENPEVSKYPAGVPQESQEAYIQSIIDAMQTAGIINRGDSITGEQIAPIIAAVKMGIDTADATATASDIITGKTAYAKGNKITGSMTSLTDSNMDINVGIDGLITAEANNIDRTPHFLAGSQMIFKQHQLPTSQGGAFTPGTRPITAATGGSFVKNNVTIAGNSNLIPANIKRNVYIFGVQGTLEGIENLSYNDGITAQYVTTSGGRTTVRLLHMTSLSFTPKAAYVYLRDSLPAANGSALISVFIDASGRCIQTYKSSSNNTMNVGSTCTWYGSSMANGALADIKIDQNLGFGGPYIAAIYG